MKQIVTSDIGGTHARFALAQIEAGRVIGVGETVILKTNEHASFQTAWEEFGRRCGIALPDALAMAFAGPVQGDLLKLTNNPWVIRRALMRDKLGVDQFTVVNDFGAVAHAVATLGPSAYSHLCGPDRGLPEEGIVTVVGPGTGLGVAALLRGRDGSYQVIETEGGHVDFAPLDPLEDAILAALRRSFRRVSVERLISGRGLANIYESLASIEKRPSATRDDKELWDIALQGSDSLAAAALDRFCLIFGAVAGDLALAHGAQAVVVGGGLGSRLSAYLPRSGFRDRFIAKGRFERRMDDMPVKLITYPEPGLIGAAAAFAREHG